MYFKREHVEQAKRMKIKLKTESSFEKPETNSVTPENIKNRRNPVITFERPKLIYSLMAPPAMPSELAHLETREAPPRPEVRVFFARQNSVLPFLFYKK